MAESILEGELMQLIEKAIELATHKERSIRIGLLEVLMGEIRLMQVQNKTEFEALKLQMAECEARHQASHEQHTRLLHQAYELLRELSDEGGDLTLQQSIDLLDEIRCRGNEHRSYHRIRFGDR